MAIFKLFDFDIKPIRDKCNIVADFMSGIQVMKSSVENIGNRDQVESVPFDSILEQVHSFGNFGMEDYDGIHPKYLAAPDSSFSYNLQG